MDGNGSQLGNVQSLVDGRTGEHSMTPFTPNCNTTVPWTPDGEVFLETDNVLLECVEMSAFRTALDCGVLPVVTLLGAAGNVLCVVVFLRQRYRSVAKPLLLGLCVTDLLLLLATFITCLPCMARSATSPESGRELQIALKPQVAVFRDIMSRVTIFLSLAIGVERCVAVTRPFKLRAVCTVPRTRTTVLLVFLALFALQAPAFFRYDVSHHVNPPSNVTKATFHETAFYRDNKRVLDFYFDYFLLVMLRGLPDVSLLVCFSIILVSLKRRLQSAYPKVPKFAARTCHHGHRGSDAMDTGEHGDLMLEEKKLTRALLVVILVSLLSEIPNFVTAVCYVVRPEHQSSSVFIVTRDVCRLLTVLNSALNFPLFMIMYKNFSVTFKTVTRRCSRA